MSAKQKEKKSKVDKLLCGGIAIALKEVAESDMSGTNRGEAYVTLALIKVLESLEKQTKDSTILHEYIHHWLWNTGFVDVFGSLFEKLPEGENTFTQVIANMMYDFIILNLSLNFF